jgi:hypothetical protein
MHDQVVVALQKRWGAGSVFDAVEGLNQAPGAALGASYAVGFLFIRTRRSCTT